MDSGGIVDIKDIFFDLDHTLWDFERNANETLAELFQDHGFDSHIESAQLFINKYQDINSHYWGLYREGKIEKAKLRHVRFEETFEHFGVPGAAELSHKIGAEYLERCPLKTHLFEGAIDVLDKLKPKYRLHIITNGFLEVQHIKMESSGLTDYFDLVLCSEEVGVNKPHPDIFNSALERTGAAAPKSVMIGDTYEVDILGARAVGMHAIYFNTKNELVEGESQQIHHLSELIEVFD